MCLPQKSNGPLLLLLLLLPEAATTRYEGSSHRNVFGHLTNSSINRKSPFASHDKDVIGDGCKWTLRRLRGWCVMTPLLLLLQLYYFCFYYYYYYYYHYYYYYCSSILTRYILLFFSSRFKTIILVDDVLPTSRKIMLQKSEGRNTPPTTRRKHCRSPIRILYVQKSKKATKKKYQRKKRH